MSGPTAAARVARLLAGRIERGSLRGVSLTLDYASVTVRLPHLGQSMLHDQRAHDAWAEMLRLYPGGKTRREGFYTLKVGGSRSRRPQHFDRVMHQVLLDDGVGTLFVHGYVPHEHPMTASAFKASGEAPQAWYCNHCGRRLTRAQARERGLVS